MHTLLVYGPIPRMAVKPKSLYVFTIQISFSRIQLLFLHLFYFCSRQTHHGFFPPPWEKTKPTPPSKKLKRKTHPNKLKTNKTNWKIIHDLPLCLLWNIYLYVCLFGWFWVLFFVFVNITSTEAKMVQREVIQIKKKKITVIYSPMPWEQEGTNALNIVSHCPNPSLSLVVIIYFFVYTGKEAERSVWVSEASLLD